MYSSELEELRHNKRISYASPVNMASPWLCRICLRCRSVFFSHGQGTQGVSSRVGSIHQGDLSRNLRPFNVTFDRSIGVAVSLQRLFPLQKFIGEAKMWLNDDVQAASSYKAVSPWERHVKGSHDLGYANRCTSRHAHAAVNQGCCSVASSALCSSVSFSIQDNTHSDASRHELTDKFQTPREFGR
jgi:hypothetical protein